MSLRAKRGNPWESKKQKAKCKMTKQKLKSKIFLHFDIVQDLEFYNG